LKSSLTSFAVHSNAKFLTRSLFDLISSLSTTAWALSALRFPRSLSFLFFCSCSNKVGCFYDRLSLRAWSSREKFWSFLIARSADSVVSISTNPKPFDYWLSPRLTILTLRTLPLRFDTLNSSSICSSFVMKFRFLMKTVLARDSFWSFSSYF